jgi:hypothetical protein
MYSTLFAIVYDRTAAAKLTTPRLTYITTATTVATVVAAIVVVAASVV